MFCLFVCSSSFATQIDAACEKKLTSAAIKEKESHLFLDYTVEGVVRSDLFNDYVQVVGTFSDADEDYSYAEIYEVGVTKNTCDIKSVEIVEIIEN
jgi:hypothetical protein